MKDEILTGDIRKVLIRFSIPIMLSMAATQFYSMADSMIIGLKLGANSLAAVSNASTILMLFLFISGGLELGANVFVASSKAILSKEEMMKSSYNIIFLDFIVSIVLLILGQLFFAKFLNLINTPIEIMEEAIIYGRIYLFGIPFLMLYDLMKQMLMGYGDTKRPMNLVFITTLFNIGLDFILIYIFHLGVSGAAIASVFAQIVGLIPCSIMIYKTFLNQPFQKSFIDIKYFKEIAQLALPSILQQLLVPFSSMVKQSLLGGIGVNAIAGFSAADKITNLLMMPIVGYIQSLVVFLAQNISMNKKKRINGAIKISYQLLFLVTTVLIICVFLFNEHMLSLFTDNNEAILFGRIILMHEPYFYYFIAARHLNEGILRGYKKMNYYLLSSTMTILLTVGLSKVLVERIGYNGFYFATGLGSIFGMFFAIYLVRFTRKPKIKAKYKVLSMKKN